MKPIDPAGFESMFQANVDPWNYTASRFEAVKRGVLLRACGLRCRGRVLELACANGETTKALAPKALRLLALDGSSTAIAEARRRTQAYCNITIQQAELPGGMPRGQFDLIVVSELLYYLPRHKLRQLLPRIAKAAAPNSRIVLLHHLRLFSDASLTPSFAHAEARRYFDTFCAPPVRSRRGQYELLTFDRKLKL